ncbi:serine/threonine-protein kinase [Streptomyces sp. NPDC005322]|uniref:serine/threonine-protein kinase n=1 Tax=unclassified Streptomyces TaxID=2593676 RepID=UPI0033A19A82
MTPPGPEDEPGVGSPNSGTDLALEHSDPARIGPFQLLGRLGAGGMGRVYLGRSRTGQLAAIKVLHDSLADDQDFRRRFERELAAASSVSGRFSAAVLASGRADEPRLWMATEYVPGPSLHQAVGIFGPLPPPTLLALWLGLLGALQSIHAVGIVHRDLKPSNVLLARDGPRVIDFGVSTVLDTTPLTRTGMVIGTPAYISPEQIRGGPVGPESDVFALGCTLAFAASGDSPFGGASSVQMLFRVVHEEPDLTGLPQQIASLVRPCLAKEPQERPSLTDLIGMVPAAETDSASQSLAHGMWLPEAIERQTSEKADQVFAWDAQRRPPGLTELPAPRAVGSPDRTWEGPTGQSHTTSQGGPDQTLVPGRTGHVHEPLPTPPTLPPGGTVGPPNGGPPSAHDGSYGTDGPGDAGDEVSLRTHTVLVPADSPPLPRALHRPWHRWFRNRR